ncbi:hypothetical protein A2450_04895 [candidate division WWE3 bacterium RIFOXYC2_FULL_40_11]|uniref:Uncharacterized protein n=1 Tax=candidate division WWE3 bacterium RIFOXYA2_FULL_46_9 TaxID=1802636 RepID=A0A1F4W0T6_UNCKA|nr:MAG: hypothetical protein A3K58_02075 [candidate division WWE3 bacterium RIFOXYB1_FULL_40_22]OGC61642.1 MAG: hypothetical protein A3K37_02075 [candidate division WWE3 bacterium RIFOXYA1_FULL_40_11]OGC62653.1 MAG: hypothetical protein A2264_02140 [candidate division WWE3 bacterium RIFOXYA2_FULL_46_9]OGC64681.1 MAG: hypothetical protein A2326_01370 [candidate division WWE3 bacterium RIFOXYB2_FULL_41_6]OGC67175.1 MAG: hypothetical protein A2450_04895 [candidate division WWE3 bacterium RIFOXYC2_
MNYIITHAWKTLPSKLLVKFEFMLSDSVHFMSAESVKNMLSQVPMCVFEHIPYEITGKSPYELTVRFIDFLTRIEINCPPSCFHGMPALPVFILCYLELYKSSYVYPVGMNNWLCDMKSAGYLAENGVKNG